MGYEIDGETRGGLGEMPNVMTLFKSGVGTLLILAGVSLGFYVASTVFKLLDGQEPPGLVANFPKGQLAGQVEVPEKGPVKFDFSPDVVKPGLYFLSFLLLTIPSAFALGMLKVGASLFDFESVKVMRELLAQLRKHS